MKRILKVENYNFLAVLFLDLEKALSKYERSKNVRGRGDALRRKAELTDNPVWTAQVSLDKQREEMLQSKGSNAESKVALYTDIIHTQNLLNEQLKKTSKDANTIPSNLFIPAEPVKNVIPAEKVKKPRFVVKRKLG